MRYLLGTRFLWRKPCLGSLGQAEDEKSLMMSLMHRFFGHWRGYSIYMGLVGNAVTINAYRSYHRPYHLYGNYGQAVLRVFPSVSGCRHHVPQRVHNSNGLSHGWSDGCTTR